MTKHRLFMAAVALALPATLAQAEDQPAAESPEAAALFKQLDTNSDGQLTADEVPGERKPLFDRLVRLADKDSDGKLSPAEFAAGLKGPSSSDTPANEKSDAEKSGADKPKGEKKPGREGRPEPGAFFARLDKNGDGKLTADEVPEQGRERFEKLIARADKDKDGSVSREEFAAAGPPGRPGLPGQGGEAPDPQRLFGRLDKNGDGKVTGDEAPEERQQMVERMIARGDKDGDKSLSLDEFSAVFARRPGGPETEAAPNAVLKKETPGGKKNKKNKKPGKGGKNKGAKLGPPSGLFSALDSNHDGQLSSEEIGAASDVIRKLDKNSDGNVSSEELLASVPKKKKNK